ncbi:MAG: cysteine-rich KTR domain-containing protein [Eubacteriales bacterium]
MLHRKIRNNNSDIWFLFRDFSFYEQDLIQADTALRNFPLYCPKCKHEILIDATAGR